MGPWFLTGSPRYLSQSEYLHAYSRVKYIFVSVHYAFDVRISSCLKRLQRYRYVLVCIHNQRNIKGVVGVGGLEGDILKPVGNTL